MHGNTGRVHTQEAKSKMSLASLGRKASEETRRKMSKTRKGMKRPPMTVEWRQHISAGKTGKRLPLFTVEHKHKLSEAQRGNHKGLGKKRSMETRRRMSEARKGEKSHNWKGGLEPINQAVRQSLEYRVWRESVFMRDGWICQRCHVRGGRLHPHHIINFSDSPEVRFVTENGITFCETCHRAFHKRYGQTGNNADQLEEFLCQ